MNTFKQPKAYPGILLADGTLLVNYGESASITSLIEVAQRLNGKLVTVKGTLTFTPNSEAL